MEIRVTRQFLTEARKDPAAVTECVEQLIARPPHVSGACATPLEGQRLLGWEFQPGRLDLLVLAPDRAAHVAYPLADLSLAELRALEVPDAAIAAVQRARTAGELDGLGLPVPALLRLRFRMLQKGLGETLQLERRAESFEHLEQFLRGEITELLLNLDEIQRPIVNLPVPGPIIVRGVAGSGKTAVALHRIHAILRGGSRLSPPRILCLTYNRSLRDATVELLQSLGVKPGLVEIKNIHKWCAGFLGSSACRTYLQNDERRDLIGAARTQVKRSSRGSALWNYPDSFWDEEIHRIKGQVLGAAEEYLSMTRYGAGRALDTRLRELVWKVYETYGALCASRRALDWDDVTRLAHQKLVSLGSSLPAYDHVFVDEGQDFTAIGLRIAALLAGGPANLMVSFDPAQSIYEKGFRWKNCGIAAHGSRSFSLQRNHRNSTQILDFARPLIEAIRNDPAETDGGGREDLIDPVPGLRSGCAPQIIKAPARQEAEHLSTLIREAMEKDRIPPQNIAVLCFKAHKRERIVEVLTAAGILCQVHDTRTDLRLTDPSVKVLTMHSAKGLEFPVVYLIASARDLEVPRKHSDPADASAFIARSRKVMYMAMTRALTRLTLVHDELDGSPLDALLGPTST